MAFINPIKSFKNAALMLRSNSDSAVLYGDNCVFAAFGNGDKNASVFHIIFYRIFPQVVNNFVQKSFNSVYKNTFAGNREGNSFFCRQYSSVSGLPQSVVGTALNTKFPSAPRIRLPSSSSSYTRCCFIPHLPFCSMGRIGQST